MSGAERTETHGSAGAVIGAALALLALAGLLAHLAARAADHGAPDAALLCEETLPSPRPLGLEPTGAERLPSGGELLRLAPSEPAAEAPEEVLIFRLGSAAAAASLLAPASQGPEAALAIRAWEEEPTTALRAEIERGEHLFGPYVVPTVRERAFLASGAWRDVRRADLSTPGRAWVVVALWPENVEAPEPPFLAILDGVARPAAPADGER